MTGVLTWALRVVWLTLPLTAGSAFADALADTSRPVQLTSAVLLWGGWAVVVVLALVPSVTSLTLLRTIVPAAPLAALAATLVAAVLALTAEVGQAFVQASAYGNERRFPLRPPGPLLAGPLPLLWVVSVGALAVGTVLLAARAWVGGGLVVALGLLTVVPAVRRFHLLARRWLVYVPAGLVVHDHLVLAETAMFPRRQVRAVEPALAGTGATDLTAGALGRALEVSLADHETIVLAAGTRGGTPRPIHARAVLVAPSRTGAALAAYAEDGARG